MVTILYRDHDLVVCVKPAGVLSQDGGENSMPYQLKQQLNTRYCGVVHRLDKEVGGVMVYALSAKGVTALSKLVQNRELDKTYLAVVEGRPAEDEAVLEDLLFHDQARNKTFVVDRERKNVKAAKLDYTVLRSAEDRSLVKVHLHTGRTHQIRVQFASRQLPLVGDRKYGAKATEEEFGLWSYQLKFTHPITGKPMDFKQNPPDLKPWNGFEE